MYTFSAEELISRIHANSSKAVIYATGGAVQAQSWLLCVPGASNTVLECSVPYARDSLVDLLGAEPAQYCCEQTAVELALAAYRRAAQLTSFGTHILGVGATCALATVPPKRGDHRALIACHDGTAGTHVAELTFSKGQRSRAQEDSVASLALVQLLAKASGETVHGPPLFTSVNAPGGSTSHPTPPTAANGHHAAAANGHAAGGAIAELPAGDLFVYKHLPAPDPLQELLAGRVRCVEFASGQVVVDAPRRGKTLLPGSFNPLHRGHTELLKASVRALNGSREAAFELSVGNADKGRLHVVYLTRHAVHTLSLSARGNPAAPPYQPVASEHPQGLLPLDEVRRRVQQFVDAGLPLVVTSAPLFINKAALMPDSCFVVGYDTAVRMVMPKYYGNSEAQMYAEFDRLRRAGCSFLVAGRKDANSYEFKVLEDLDVPPPLADLFRGLSERHFRVDLSSTELRTQRSASAPL